MPEEQVGKEAQTPEGNIVPAAPQSGQKRERWRPGMTSVLAVAGISTCLTHFLGFPCAAAANGGGAFLAAYLILFALIGLPLLWLEAACGKAGGRVGSGSLPAAFGRISGTRSARYIGIIGIVASLLMLVTFNYAASWSLSYAFFSFGGCCDELRGKDALGAFFDGFTGNGSQNFSFASAAGWQSGRIEIPFDKYYGDGTYRVDFDYDAGSGARSSGRTAFSVFSTGDNMRRIDFAAGIPEDVESVEPANNSVLVGTPETIAVKLRASSRAKDFRARVSWEGGYFSWRWSALLFFSLTVLAAAYVMYLGHGPFLNALAKIALPAAVAATVLVALRLLSWSGPEQAQAGRDYLDGLRLVWFSDFSKLLCVKTWLAAGGQVLLATGVFCGSVHAFSSFLDECDSAVSTATSVCAVSVLTEAFIAGAMAVPAAVMFLGPAQAVSAAGEGPAYMGFVVMPHVFRSLEASGTLGALWYSFLFISCVFSSVSLAYPALVFLREEAGLPHKNAVAFIAALTFTAGLPVLFNYQAGFMAQMQYLALLFLALYGFAETVFFRLGDRLDGLYAPPLYRLSLKYAAPLFTAAILAAWAFQYSSDAFMYARRPSGVPAFPLGALALTAGITAIFIFLARGSGRKEEKPAPLPEK